MNQYLYAELVTVAVTGERLTRFDMVSWCVGFYGKVDAEILDCIRKLYEDMFIDE